MQCRQRVEYLLTEIGQSLIDLQGQTADWNIECPNELSLLLEQCTYLTILQNSISSVKEAARVTRMDDFSS